MKKLLTEKNILYEDLIYLNHKKTKTTLSLNDYYKSPVIGKAEGIYAVDTIS